MPPHAPAYLSDILLCQAWRGLTQFILFGRSVPPFASRAVWSAIQQECIDLCITHAHLLQGTHPSKKATSIRDVKSYRLHPFRRLACFLSNGISPLPTPVTVLMYTSQRSFEWSSHSPSHSVGSSFQPSLTFSDPVFIFCTSLHNVPKSLTEQSTSDPPHAVGISFAADVLKFNSPLILVLCETAMSYILSCIIDNKKHNTLCSALLHLYWALPIRCPPSSDPHRSSPWLCQSHY